jgi:magnesium transporter
MRLYEEDKDLIEDIMLSTTELIELTKSRLRTLVNIRQAYDTIATNNLNKTFKRLTSIGIFLSIPMIFSGLWGMNVAVPFQDNTQAFLIILLLAATCIYFTVRFFRKRNWL